MSDVWLSLADPVLPLALPFSLPWCPTMGTIIPGVEAQGLVLVVCQSTEMFPPTWDKEKRPKN